MRRIWDFSDHVVFVFIPRDNFKLGSTPTWGDFLLVHGVLGAVNELLHALGAIAEPTEFVGPRPPLDTRFCSETNRSRPFASDAAVRLVEVGNLCVPIATLVPLVGTCTFCLWITTCSVPSRSLVFPTSFHWSQPGSHCCHLDCSLLPLQATD